MPDPSPDSLPDSWPAPRSEQSLPTTDTSTTAPARVVVLISGRGRNFEAIYQASLNSDTDYQVVAAISNRPDAAGLSFARSNNVAARIVDHQSFAERDHFESALKQEIDQFQPDIVVLAGFMRRLGADFVRHYRGRMINIHPSLLPKFRGLHTHRRALEEKETEHGASVHFVSEELDGGPVIAQGTIPVLDSDNEDSLAARILNSVELTLYPKCVQLLAQRRIQWTDNQLLFEDQPLQQPLRIEDIEACQTKQAQH